MLFGLLALLLVAFVLLGGVTVAITVSLRQYHATRSLWYALCCLLGIALSAAALSFSVIWPFMQMDEGDWSHGQMDTFKTPLGGGFYVASADSPKDLPLPLYRRSEQNESGDNDTQIDTAVALACSSGVVSVKTQHDYLVIDHPGRTFSRHNTLPQQWLTLDGFDKTPCAQPPKGENNSLKVLLGLLVGPLLSGLVLLPLWIWQPSRRKGMAP